MFDFYLVVLYFINKKKYVVKFKVLFKKFCEVSLSSEIFYKSKVKCKFTEQIKFLFKTKLSFDNKQD